MDFVIWNLINILDEYRMRKTKKYTKRVLELDYWNSGQSLIEVVIAVAILTTALIGILGLITSAFTAASNSKFKNQASFLAQEALETVYNIKDTNWRKGLTPWDTNFYDQGVGKGDGWYKLNSYDQTNGWILAFKSVSETSDDAALVLDGTIFTRYIKVEKYQGSADKRQVTIKVTWSEKGVINKVETSSVLLNWLSATSPPPPITPSDSPKIAAGGYFTLVLKSDNTVWGVGGNNWGQLGLDKAITGNTVNTWTQLSINSVQAVAAGYEFSLALKSDGTVWGTGGNSGGALGVGDYTDRYGWTQALTSPGTPLTGVVAISGRSQQSFALKSDGTVWGTGWNGYSQLGLGDDQNRNYWTRVNSLSTDVTGIAAGSRHTLALKSNGEVWVTGKNGYGQLGLGYNSYSRTLFEKSLIDSVSVLAPGLEHSLALKSDGTVWATGWNSYGQLGLGNSGPGTDKNNWTKTPLVLIKYIIARGEQSFALDSYGTVWATGRNSYGQLGFAIGDTTSRNAWAQTSMTGAVGISGGTDHSVALKSDGIVWVTGSNAWGQLGLGNYNDKQVWTPTTMDLW